MEKHTLKDMTNEELVIMEKMSRAVCRRRELDSNRGETEIFAEYSEKMEETNKHLRIYNEIIEEMGRRLYEMV